MEKKKLLETLETLHAELEDATAVDEETQALLATLTDDIRRLSQPGEGEDGADIAQLSEQVNSLMLKFETDYPQLTRALNQVSSALANLGI